MESLHLTKTKTGSYTYRRRIPQQLQDLIGRKEISRTLGKQQHEAIVKASELDQAINQGLTLKTLNSVPETLIQEMLITKLSLTLSNSIDMNPTGWSSIAKGYLKQSQVTPMEYNTRKYFFTILMPVVLKVLLKSEDIDINKLTYSKLIEIRKLFLKFPKRNIWKYRSMNTYTLVHSIHNRKIEIAHDQLVSIESTNKSLKRIKSLLIFSQKLGHYKGFIPNFTIDNKQLSRSQRKDFTKDDIKIIEEQLQDTHIYPMIKILQFTGMRLSELYKCSILAIEGVLCFDLRTTKGSPLKTLSSYRIIPVHDSLLEHLDDLPALTNKFSSNYISKRFKKDIKRILEDTQGKSLYSLRHSFATNLIANSVQPEIVSELMGHSHNSMTMNRYVKGYPLKVLKKAIATL